MRPPQVPSKAYEVDCRRSGTEIKQVGNVASLTSGLGSLNDKKPESQGESLHVLAWLERDAREVDRALRRGEHVWCHCAQGFNRGPSGVLAYLLSYTDATWQQACRRVSDARSRARTTRNTFHVELLMLSKKVRGRLRTRVTSLLSERPQLNTIRHVVIWLDPWSRERDLLAAVVDR